MKRWLPLGLLALLGAAAPAAAATIEVTTENDYGRGSLGDAILQSDPGDTIEIPPGEYLLRNGEVLEANDLTLRGAGEDQTTIVPSGGGEALADSGVKTIGLDVADPLNEESSDGGTQDISTQAQILAVIATLAIFVFVLELVRRRRLVERYALLWMTAALALLVLAIWTEGLDVIKNLIGVEEPANAIFILAFGVAFLLLLNFSVVSSRLSEESKILAQEVARLDTELRAEQERNGAPVGAEKPGDHA